MSWTWRLHVHSLTLLLQRLCIPEAQNKTEVNHTACRNHLSGSAWGISKYHGEGVEEEWASGFHLPALLFSVASSRNSVYFLSFLEHDFLAGPQIKHSGLFQFQRVCVHVPETQRLSFSRHSHSGAVYHAQAFYDHLQVMVLPRY